VEPEYSPFGQQENDTLLSLLYQKATEGVLWLECNVQINCYVFPQFTVSKSCRADFWGYFAVQNVFDGGHKVRCKIDTATQTASMHAIIKDPVPHVALHASAKMDKSGIPSLGLSAKLTPPLAW